MVLIRRLKLFYQKHDCLKGEFDSRSYVSETKLGKPIAVTARGLGLLGLLSNQETMHDESRCSASRATTYTK
jgi:hypothetical protein